jgi:hypothetical protein
MTAAADAVNVAVAYSGPEISTMTTETPISFPMITLSITAKCSADLATAAKLPGVIFRALRKVGVSAVVTSVQSENESQPVLSAGVGSMAPLSGGGTAITGKGIQSGGTGWGGGSAPSTD